MLSDWLLRLTDAADLYQSVWLQSSRRWQAANGVDFINIDWRRVSYVARQPECRCADPETCPFPEKSSTATARQNGSTVQTDLDKSNLSDLKAQGGTLFAWSYSKRRGEL